MEFPSYSLHDAHIVVWNTEWILNTVLVLSVYLISIRVVDYGSLGLLSENKIEREKTVLGKQISH